MAGLSTLRTAPGAAGEKGRLSEPRTAPVAAGGDFSTKDSSWCCRGRCDVSTKDSARLPPGEERLQHQGQRLVLPGKERLRHQGQHLLRRERRGELGPLGATVMMLSSDRALGPGGGACTHHLVRFSATASGSRHRHTEFPRASAAHLCPVHPSASCSSTRGRCSGTRQARAGRGGGLLRRLL